MSYEKKDDRRWPLLKEIKNYREVLWFQDQRKLPEAVDEQEQLWDRNMKDASDRWERFKPLIRKLFPETEPSEGAVFSELREVPEMGTSVGFQGKLFMKLDSELPIAGSVKARGGVYEILKLAETIALSEPGFTVATNYEILAEDSFRALFSQWEVIVGSTGNLGISIGTVSAVLGFQVTVHMSQDAKTWKKERLRSYGVTVIEHPDDYSKAVEAGRKQAASNEKAHFVDDENSSDLFWGYSVAAIELKEQLGAAGIFPTPKSPIDVYIPCGVGGAPGGICLGLNRVFGSAVRCWFVEPTHAPCMLLGLMTGEHDGVSVQDFGLDGKTVADGLAVGRASRLAGKMVEKLVAGVFTVDDARLLPWVRQLNQLEGIFIEPSAAAGFIGPSVRFESPYSVVWATGGKLVPEDERQRMLND